jgi:hypothetical protein
VTRIRSLLGGTTFSSSPDRVELPTDDVAMHSTPRGFDQNLTDAAIENLRRWYAKDVEFIRLCRELRQDQTLANDLR